MDIFQPCKPAVAHGGFDAATVGNAEHTIVITAVDASQNASSTQLIVERLLPEESPEPTDDPEEPSGEDESDPPDEESGDDPSNDPPPDNDEEPLPTILDNPPAINPRELNAQAPD